jgi:hypothetical protein
VLSPAAKPKVFIASSWAALKIARKLKRKLDDERPRVAEVILWEDAFPVGGIILNTLREQAAAVDFAVVLFTAEDVVRDANNVEMRAPRDNCVFELGLFMGALGLEPRRALLLRAKNSSLLSDLGGLVYGELPDSTDTSEKREELLDRAVEQIKSSVNDLKYCFNHPPYPEPRIIPKDRLMDLEKPSLLGGKLVDSDTTEVLIHTCQPLELNHDLAKTVCENMSADISYRYFFEAEAGSIKFFSSLIRTLAAAPIHVRDPEKLNSERWRDLMRVNEQNVIRALKIMRSQLRIYFLARKPDLEFCIHNATHENEAICYLRHTADSFVEWFRGESAKYVADRLKTKCFDDEDMVFQGSAGWDLYSQEHRSFLRELKEDTLRKFPDGRLRVKVAQMCFGERG